MSSRRRRAAEARNPLREEEDGPPITEHKNELLRESICAGQSLLEMLDDDLEVAWGAWLDMNQQLEGSPFDVVLQKKTATCRGRVRGLAQAITTVRSPFSRTNMGARSTAWAQAIKNTEDEALARVRLQRKAGR